MTKKKNVILPLAAIVVAGIALFGAARVYAAPTYDNGNFFISDKNNITVTTGTDGILFSATGGEFEMTYLQPIDVDELTAENEYLSLQLIPDTTGVESTPDAAYSALRNQALVVTLTDSVDKTQQISHILYLGSWYGETKTKLTYALTDELSWKTVSEGDGASGAYAGGAQTAGYNGNTAITGVDPFPFDFLTPYFFWVNDSWDIGFKFDMDTKTAYTDSPVGMGSGSAVWNDLCSMDLRKEEYLSVSLNGMTDDELAERYTAEHVNNLFSSGEVVLSIAGYNLKDESFDFKISALGGQDLENNGYRIVNYTPPALSCTGEVRLYEGVTYNLLHLVSAVSADKSLEYEVRVSENGNLLENADYTAFIPTGGAEYVIEYTATDGGGLVSETLVVETTSVALELNIGENVSLGVPEQQLPLPSLPENWGYSVTIYAADDTQRQNPLPLITELGDYVAVYELYSEETGVVVRECTFTATDDSAPAFLSEPQYVGNAENGAFYEYSEIEIAEPDARDNFYPDFEWNAEVFFNGDAVAVADGAFLAENVGIYEIRYTLKDASDNTAVYSFYLEVTENKELPSIELSGNYQNEYRVGDEVPVLSAQATDINGNALAVKIAYRIGADGAENAISAGENLSLSEEGRVYLVYTATDAAGNTAVRTVTFEVLKKEGGCGGCSGSVGGGAALLSVLPLLGVTALLRKKRR